MVFTDGNRTVWLADLDPRTGLFTTDTGRQVLVDTGHARLADTDNGPEFGIDRDGWSIVYTKPIQSEYRLHRARPTNDGFDIQVVPSQVPLLGATVSKDPDADTTWVFAIRDGWDIGDAVALDLATPDTIQRLGPAIDGTTDGRWIDGRPLGITTVDAAAKGTIRARSSRLYEMKISATPCFASQ